MKQIIITNWRFHLILIISISNHLVKVYGQPSFDKRLEEIHAELEVLSDSLSPGLNEVVEFDLINTPIREFLGLLATAHELDISVSSSVNRVVSNHFSKARVKDVLLFLCQAHLLDIKFFNSILRFEPYEGPSPPPVPYVEKKLNIHYDSSTQKLKVDLKNDSLRLFVKQLSKVSGRNVVTSDNLKNHLITSYLQDVDFTRGLETLAKTNGLLIKQDGEFFFFEEPEQAPVPTAKKTRNSSGRKSSNVNNKSFLDVTAIEKGGEDFLTIDARQMPIVDLIEEVAQEIAQDYFFFTLPEQVVTAHFTNMTFGEVLAKVLQPTEHTFVKSGGVFLIGDRYMEGLRESEIVKLKFRSVEGIDLLIPQDTKKDVQISVFPELNAVILSGSAPQIREIKSFLKALDEPVPNILIEVIVVDVKKGF